MDIFKLIVAGVLGVVLGVGTAVYINNTPQTPTTQTTQKFGSLASPELPYDHLTWGAVSEYHFSQAMTQNASTSCNWQTPAATSTVKVTVRFAFASTAAAFIEIGKSAGPQATTTSLGKFTLAAGAQGTVISSSTVAATDLGIDPVSVVAPSTWLAVKGGGFGLGTIPTGICNFSAVTLP